MSRSTVTDWTGYDQTNASAAVRWQARPPGSVSMTGMNPARHQWCVAVTTTHRININPIHQLSYIVFQKCGLRNLLNLKNLESISTIFGTPHILCVAGCRSSRVPDLRSIGRGWEGNRMSGNSLATRQTSVVLQLRAHGMEKGDKHPLPSLVEQGRLNLLPFYISCKS